MSFKTSEVHENLRQRVREFAESEIKPIAFMLDQNNEFPTEAIKKFAEMGLMGIPYPKEYGGAGMDTLSYAIAVEELSKSMFDETFVCFADEQILQVFKRFLCE